MADHSNIGWTEASWPITTGCDHVSPGCDGCYAAELTSSRLAHLPEYAGLAVAGRFTGEVRLHPDRLDQPLHWRKPRKIFVCSMSDLFHEDVPDEFIARAFAVMAVTPHHTYQVLTKRHARLRTLLNNPEFRRQVYDLASEIALAGVFYAPPTGHRANDSDWWPLPNVHIGVSVENQQWADIRIPALAGTPAAVRWLSIEPMVGPIDLTPWMPPGLARWQCSGCRHYFTGPVQQTCPGCDRVGYWTGSHTGNGRPNGQPIGWVVIGGESRQPHHPPRRMDPAWLRAVCDTATAAGVSLFVKQAGTVLAREWGIPGAGHKLGALPAEFRIQQYPAEVHS